MRSRFWTPREAPEITTESLNDDQFAALRRKTVNKS